MTSDKNIQEIEKLDINAILYKYLRYWPWFLLSVAICYAIGYGFARYSVPVYQASASLLIKDEQKGFTPDSKVLEELNLNTGSALLENEIELLHARSLATKVIDNLKLTVTYWHEGRVRDVEMYPDSPIAIQINSLDQYAYGHPLFVEKLNQSQYKLLDEEKDPMGTFPFGKFIKSKYGLLRVLPTVDSLGKQQSNTNFTKVLFGKKDQLIGEIVKGLKTIPSNEYGTVIKLNYENTSQEKAIRILDNILNEYARGSVEDKNLTVANTLVFVEDRLGLINKELVDVEQDVERYRREAGISDISSEANTFLENAKENDAKLNELDIQIKVLDNIEKSINNSDVSNLSMGTNMLNDPVLTGYITQLSTLEMQREALSRSSTKNNPYLQTIESQQNSIKQAIKASLKSTRANLNISKKSYDTVNKKLSSEINAIPTKERKFVSIKRQADTKANLYLLLLEKREEAALSIASSVANSKVIDRAYISNIAIRPSKRNIQVISIFLGLLIPIAFLYLKNLLNDTLTSKQDIEEKLNKNIFAQIGLYKKTETEPILDIKSRSLIAEQFRMVRSNTNFLLDHKAGEGRVFLVTSSIPGEGKSFFAGNLARFYGALDKKVLIVGLDLRMPMLSEYFHVEADKGLSNYLIGQYDLDTITKKSIYENLNFIPAGPIPPNPAELLVKPEMAKFFEQVKQEYDYIVLDTPPIQIVGDAFSLAAYVDVCFYLMRYNKTPKSLLSEIKKFEAKRIFKTSQYIFNAVETQEGEGYGAYGKGYYG